MLKNVCPGCSGCKLSGPDSQRNHSTCVLTYQETLHHEYMASSSVWARMSLKIFQHWIGHGSGRDTRMKTKVMCLANCTGFKKLFGSVKSDKSSSWPDLTEWKSSGRGFPLSTLMSISESSWASDCFCPIQCFSCRARTTVFLQENFLSKTCYWQVHTDEHFCIDQNIQETKTVPAKRRTSTLATRF